MSAEKEIIINEVLCYISNRIDVIDEQAITQICTSNFSEKEIECAKAVICEYLGMRLTTRKGDGRSVKHIQDIIKMMKETEPDNLPLFVAKDLNKIPPVTFDHVDVSKILKELISLRSEISTLKANMIHKSEIAELKNDMDCIKTKICIKSNSINSNVQTSELQGHSLLVSPADEVEGSLRKTASPLPVSQSVPQETHSNKFRTNMPSQRNGGRGQADTDIRVHTHRNYNNYNYSYRDAAMASQTKHDFKSTNENLTDSEGYQIVTKKRNHYKTKNMRGKGCADDILQAVPTTSTLYISRVRPDISKEKLEEYIKKKGEKALRIEELKSYNNQTNFNTFLVTIEVCKLNTFLNEEFWPAGTVYRKFIYKNKSKHFLNGISENNKRTSTLNY